MGAQYFTFENFQSMVRHHTDILNRYDKEAGMKFSILIFSIKFRDMKQIVAITQDILRDSDAVFKDEEHIFILLPMTDMPGTLRVRFLIEDYLKEKLVDDIIITYPDDGTSGDEIMDKIKAYIKEARGEEIDFPHTTISG